MVVQFTYLDFGHLFDLEAFFCRQIQYKYLRKSHEIQHISVAGVRQIRDAYTSNPPNGIEINDIM